MEYEEYYDAELTQALYECRSLNEGIRKIESKTKQDSRKILKVSWTSPAI